MLVEMLDFRLLFVSIILASLILFVPWVIVRHYLVSSQRMHEMMRLVGISPGLIVQGDGRTRAVLADARRHCRDCLATRLCDRWLAGEAACNNAFCPNVAAFNELKRRNSLTLLEDAG